MLILSEVGVSRIITAGFEPRMCSPLKKTQGRVCFGKRRDSLPLQGRSNFSLYRSNGRHNIVLESCPGQGGDGRGLGTVVYESRSPYRLCAGWRRREESTLFALFSWELAPPPCGDRALCGFGGEKSDKARYNPGRGTSSTSSSWPSDRKRRRSSLKNTLHFQQ